MVWHKITWLIIGLISFQGTGFSQNAYPYTEEKLLTQYGDSILKSPFDSTRQLYAILFKEKFHEYLLKQPNFNTAIDSIKNISVLTSDDNLLRVITWLLPSTDRNSYRYFGFVQIHDRKKKIIHTRSLQQSDSLSIHKIEKTKLLPNQWYGCIYYALLTNTYRRKKTYTLIGWQGNNRITTRKMLDIINPLSSTFTLGKSIFKEERSVSARKIYEYNAQAIMLLRYDENYSKIVMDDITPEDKSNLNNFASYGPNFKYNAFRFKKGKWNFEKDVDVRNEKTKTGTGPALEKKFRITKRPQE